MSVQAERDGVLPVFGAPTVCVQVPGVASQRSHCPVQAVLQQKPSTQLFERHSLPRVHAPPACLRQRTSLLAFVQLSVPPHAAPVAPHTQPVGEQRSATVALQALLQDVQCAISLLAKRSLHDGVPEPQQAGWPPGAPAVPAGQFSPSSVRPPAQLSSTPLQLSIAVGWMFTAATPLTGALSAQSSQPVRPVARSAHGPAHAMYLSPS